MGLTSGNGVAPAMRSITEGAGTASAVLGSLQFTVGAAVSPLVGLGGEFTARPMAVVMTVSAFSLFGARDVRPGVVTPQARVWSVWATSSSITRSGSSCQSFSST
jgi:hypothetical protein